MLVRLAIRATHQGESMGVAPTGKEVDVPVLDLFRILDRRLVEHWAAVDNQGMVQQIGAILE